jgi:hypothetical protein
VSVACVLGWAGWGCRLGQALRWVAAVAVLVAGVAIPPYLAAQYKRPPPSVGSAPHRTAFVFAPGLRLVGYQTAPDPDPRYVNVALDWQATAPISADYVIRVEALDAAGFGYGLLETLPGNGTHPTTNWIVGETFRDVLRLPVRHSASERVVRVTVFLLGDARNAVSWTLPDLTIAKRNSS